nr:MAG TPA: hypothetical protein [Caudoviricetes sp.]
MANVKKSATLEVEDVFTKQVNANYKRCKEAREEAAKQRQEKLRRMYRNNKRIATWGVVGCVAVLIAAYAMWFI